MPGSSTSSFTGPAASGETISQSADPARNLARVSGGRAVADSPTRCTGRPASRSRRASDSARCAPRLLPARACSSSITTDSTVRSSARPPRLPSSTNSDSGVVESISGGLRRWRARSACGVSPQRNAIEGARPQAGATASSSGARLCVISRARAFSGAICSARTPLPRPGRLASPSTIGRHAASDLPCPVEAITSALRPERSTGQAARCTGVGSPTALANQASSDCSTSNKDMRALWARGFLKR